jgi:hypothetical protein
MPLFRTICLIIFTSFLVAGQAQKVYVTKSGQSIVLFPNGKWEYTTAGSAEEGGMFAESTLEVNPFEIPSSDEYQLTEAEELLYNELKNRLQFIEADYFVRHLIIKTKNDNGNNVNQEDKQLEKDLEKKYKKSSDLLEKLMDFSKSDINKRQEILSDVKSETQKEFKYKSNTDNRDSDIGKTRISRIPDFELDNRSPYSITENDACEVIFNGFDNQIKKKRREIKGGNWFGYTHPKLGSYFKENDFLRGEASLMKVDNKTFLNLRLVLATRDARRSYGFIQEDAMLRITFINGDRVYLNSQVRSDGNLEAYTGNTVYTCLFPLDKDDLKELERTEIDRVGIMWSTGFEEYDIYNVDFIINQLSCLKNGQ